jgi:transcriptional regulator with XRE-family HTH domain
MLVQKLRLQHGWSQEQLADLSGLSVRTIQRIEQGQPASTESLKSLAAVFEIDFATLKEPSVNASLTPSPAMAADEALALNHVRHVRQFYLHLVRYGLVICFLTVVNVMTAPQRLWVIWVAVGWGLVLGLRGLRLFGKVPFLNAQWEKAQVEKYLGRKL